MDDYIAAGLPFTDNRAEPLLRELREFIADCDDPVVLRRLGLSLKLIGDSARGKSFNRQRKGNRTW